MPVVRDVWLGWSLDEALVEESAVQLLDAKFPPFGDGGCTKVSDIGPMTSLGGMVFG